MEPIFAVRADKAGWEVFCSADSEGAGYRPGCLWECQRFHMDCTSLAQRSEHVDNKIVTSCARDLRNSVIECSQVLETLRADVATVLLELQAPQQAFGLADNSGEG